jgi:hypothetical protein
MKKMSAVIFQWALIVTILASGASCTALQSSSGAVTLISSDELKAGGLAYEAFKNTLATQKVFDNDLSRFAS